MQNVSNITVHIDAVHKKIKVFGRLTVTLFLKFSKDPSLENHEQPAHIGNYLTRWFLLIQVGHTGRRCKVGRGPSPGSSLPPQGNR